MLATVIKGDLGGEEAGLVKEKWEDWKVGCWMRELHYSYSDDQHLPKQSLDDPSLLGQTLFIAFGI